MAFNIENSGGEFYPVVKFNAKSGRFCRVDRTDAGKEDIDISDGLSFIANWPEREYGWTHFDGNQPDFRFQHHSLGLAAKPAEEFKQSLRVRVRLCEGAGGGIHELTASSIIFLRTLSDLDTEVERSSEYEGGKLPVIAFKGANPIKGKHGTNYAPNLVITGWVEKAEFDGGSAEIEMPPPRSKPKSAETVNEGN